MTLALPPNLYEPSKAKSPFVFRDYQAQDPDAVQALWDKGFRAPCVRWATGLGKSVFLAELARRRAQAGRVLVIVDVGILAKDLVDTIEAHTGIPAGVLTGERKDGWHRRQIVVATVQSLYAKVDGKRRYEAEIDPWQFGGLLVDECESAVAEEFGGVCRHLLGGNPNLLACGATATPYRGDKQGLGKIFDWAPDLAGKGGPLNRSMVWGRDQGWLEPLWHGHLRCSLDFSTLKITRNKSGERDYSDADLTKLITADERHLRELAIAIHDGAAGEPSVIVCPATRDSDEEAEVPRALARHLIAVGGEGCAEAVWGGQGKRGDDLLSKFKRGAFPYVCTIKKCEKGFDADVVRHVFMLRKTKVPRVIEQAAGRAVRPLRSVRDALQAAPDAVARRAIIADSAKPHATFWDMVGLDARLDDADLVDVLAGDADARVKKRTKQLMLAASQADHAAQLDLEQLLAQAGREVAAERKAEADRREMEERRKRAMVQVSGKVEKHVSPDGRVTTGGIGMRSDVPARQLEILRKARVPERDVARMSPETIKKLSSQIVQRWKAGLCSWGQARVLARAGYSRDELRAMTYPEASANIDAAKANGWRRPGAEQQRQRGGWTTAPQQVRRTA